MKKMRIGKIKTRQKKKMTVKSRPPPDPRFLMAPVDFAPQRDTSLLTEESRDSSVEILNGLLEKESMTLATARKAIKAIGGGSSREDLQRVDKARQKHREAVAERIRFERNMQGRRLYRERCLHPLYSTASRDP